MLLSYLLPIKYRLSTFILRQFFNSFLLFIENYWIKSWKSSSRKSIYMLFERCHRHLKIDTRFEGAGGHRLRRWEAWTPEFLCKTFHLKAISSQKKIVAEGGGEGMERCPDFMINFCSNAKSFSNLFSYKIFVENACRNF